MSLELKSAPILPLRDIVVFPNVTTPLFVGREKSINALESVMAETKQILLLAQKNPDTDDPKDKAVPAGSVISPPTCVQADPSQS